MSWVSEETEEGEEKSEQGDMSWVIEETGEGEEKSAQGDMSWVGKNPVVGDTIG